MCTSPPGASAGARWSRERVPWDLGRHRTARGRVAGFARDPANLPAWAAGLAAGIEQRDGRWVADSPRGEVEVGFVSDEPGVLDHDVVLPGGDVVRNPPRVEPDRDACRVVFTLEQREGMTDAEFEDDAAAVRADLERLHTLLEA